MYKVSILVPIYGVEQYIERCARSLFEQTYVHLEYVFVNDCSPDRSIEILKEIMEDYPERKDAIRIVNHEKNRGLAAVRNTALKFATGEFVSHVDSDDWLENDAIENLVRVQQETGADIVSGNAIAHYSDRITSLTEPEYINKNEMIRQTIQLTLDHVIWRRLIRTSLYRDNNIAAVEGVNIGEDHYTLPRLVYYSKSFARCDKVVYHYNCLNSSSYMQSFRNGFNLRRYRNDRDSIGILIDFFSKQNELGYVNELNAIKTKYIYKSFFPAIKAGDRSVYEEQCSDWRTIDNSNKVAFGISNRRNKLLACNYYVNRMRVWCRIIIKKVFGVKLYDL